MHLSLSTQQICLPEVARLEATFRALERAAQGSRSIDAGEVEPEIIGTCCAFDACPSRRTPSCASAAGPTPTGTAGASSPWRTWFGSHHQRQRRLPRRHAARRDQRS